MYREQEYVERCACDAPAVAGCASCGRARCAFHLTRGLCMRCGEAIRREVVKRGGTRFAIATTSGAAVAYAWMIVHSGVGLLLCGPLAVALYFGLTRWQRRSLIKQMGPGLAASKGELPPPPREGDGYPENDNSVPSGTTGGRV